MVSNFLSTQPEIHTVENSQKKKPSVIAKVMDDKNSIPNKSKISTKIEGWFNFKTELKWPNIISIFILHVIMLYFCFTFKYAENWKTTIWMFATAFIRAIGISAGIHRLWSHRAYKAKWPLRVILLIFYCASGQNNPYDWVRDHRVHHKYTDTDADPHNSNRGFFFSHVGWLMMKKHPEVIRRGRQIDMSDTMTDLVFTFGCKYFLILKPIFTFVLPIMLPVYIWNETWSRAFVSQFIPYVISLNCTWMINSVAHTWGSKPYNANINPTDNELAAFFTSGEGCHNYHHMFPWDYKTSELGGNNLNFTMLFINFFAKIGWAYDLKQPSQELVRTIVMKNGDGSHPLWNAVSYENSKIE